MDPIQPKLGMTSGLTMQSIMNAPISQPDIAPMPDLDLTSKSDGASLGQQWYSAIANGSAVHNYNSSVTRVASVLWPYVNDVDPNYKALEDPQVTSRGEDFIKMYDRNIMDSPDPSITKHILEQIDTDREHQSIVENAGLFVQLAGGLTGELANPINWIPGVSMSAMAAKSGSLLGSVLLTGASTAAVAGASTNLTNKLGTYGTGQTEDQEWDMLKSSMVFGGLLGAAGGAMAGRMSVSASAADYGKATLDYLAKQEPLVEIKYPTELNAANDAPGLNLPDFTQKTTKHTVEFSGAHQTALNDTVMSNVIEHISGYKRHDSNVVQKAVEKMTDWLTPNGRLSRSNLDSVNYARYHLAPQGGTLTEKVVKGGTNEISMSVRAEADASSQMNRFQIAFDNAYYAFRKDGGNLNPHEFMKQSYAARVGRVGSGKQITNKHFQQVDTALSDLFTESGKAAKEFDFLKADADSNLYVRQQYDFTKLMRNPEQTIADIKQDFGFTDKKAVKIYNALYESAKGDVRSSSVRGENNILAGKNMPVNEAFWAKYGRDDVFDMLHFYTQRMAKDVNAARVFQPLTGETDIYKGITALMDKEIAEKGNTNVSLLQDRDAMFKDLIELADVYTGRFFQRDGGLARTIGVGMKSWQYVLRMGGQAIANIPDMVRVMALKMKDSDFAKIASSNAENTLAHLKTLPDKEAQRLLGVFDSAFTPSSRAEMLGDLINYDLPATSRIEKGVRVVSKYLTDIMSSVNLMRMYQNYLKRVATEDTAQSIIQQSYRILKGKVKAGSRMDMLYRQAGLTPELAQSLVQQFEKHSSIDLNKNTLTNLMNWDRETFTKMTALIQNEVNNHLVLRPHTADKPLFMSRAIPGIMTQFMGYSVSTLNKVLIPMLQSMGLNSDLGNRYLMYMMADLTIGSLVGFTKDAARGDTVDFTPERAIIYALNNSSTMGLFGTMDSYATRFRVGSADWLGVKTYKSNYRMAWPREIIKAAGGAAGSSMVDIVDLLAKYQSGARLSDSDYERMVKLLPFSNLLWWNWAVNGIASKKQ